MLTLRDSIKDWNKFEAVVYAGVKHAFEQMTPEQLAQMVNGPMLTLEERHQLIND